MFPRLTDDEQERVIGAVAEAVSGVKIAVIPARGGSQRIPRKNIRPFCGRPMIAWAIDTARTSGLFDHVLVSTDDEEIGEVASLGRRGAVPALRRSRRRPHQAPVR